MVNAVKQKRFLVEQLGGPEESHYRGELLVLAASQSQERQRLTASLTYLRKAHLECEANEPVGVPNESQTAPYDRYNGINE